jgi:hypothetical protein
MPLIAPIRAEWSSHNIFGKCCLLTQIQDRCCQMQAVGVSVKYSWSGGTRNDISLEGHSGALPTMVRQFVHTRYSFKNS